MGSNSGRVDSVSYLQPRQMFLSLIFLVLLYSFHPVLWFWFTALCLLVPFVVVLWTCSLSTPAVSFRKMKGTAWIEPWWVTTCLQLEEPESFFFFFTKPYEINKWRQQCRNQCKNYADIWSKAWFRVRKPESHKFIYSYNPDRIGH